MITEFIVIIIGGILMWLTPVLGMYVSGKLARRVLWIFFTFLVLVFIIGGILLVKEKRKEKQIFKIVFSNLESKMEAVLEECHKPKVYSLSTEFSDTATMTFTPRVTHANGQVSLKDRADDLSSDIGKFLTERESKEPSVTNINFDADVGRLFSYYQDIVKDYNSKFGSEVIAIRNEFSTNGKQDKELDNYYKHPSGPDEIRIIAKRIKELANQVP